MSEDIKEFIGVWVVVAFAVFILSVPLVGLKWIKSCRSSEVFNETNGTNWTCSDFFWAGDQIQTQRQTLNIEGIDLAN